MINYVGGFLFSPDLNNVVLIEKLKPEWQRYKLNGIGGKVEKNETYLEAMGREFFEETGLIIKNWHFYCQLKGKDFCVYFYYAVSDLYTEVKSIEVEQVGIYSVEYISSKQNTKTVPNLKWLVPMALVRDDSMKLFSIKEIV